jgi:putative transposase
VVLEDLKISNMSKSAKGNVEKPGKNVKAKSGLNKAILDQGWFEFRRQIEYKLNWSGGERILVNPKNTSRKCSVCGHISKENRKTQSKFSCIECGHAQNADLNAARNILAAGHAVLACGDIKLIAA